VCRVSSADFQTSLAQGHSHFLAGRFFQAHEAWEDGWRATKGTEKQLLQVLILWATAFHHREKDNRSGALTVMARALERLSVPPIQKAPFDTETLREALVESWERLSSADAQPPVPAAWDPGAVEEQIDTIDFTQRTFCPYCAEPVAVEVDFELQGGAQYVEDCPVCCNPWTVTVREEGGQIAIVLQRGDD
jgi:hypothetical protein